jgi:hypothetical protein
VSVRTNHHCFAIDQSALGSQTAYRLRDLRQPVGEILAVAAPEGQPTPSLRAMIRYPSCLTSCSQPKRVDGLSTRRGRHGRTKPTGGMRRERPGEIRHNMTPYVGGEGRSCDLPYGSNAKAPRSSFPYCCRFSCSGDDARATGHGRFCGSLVQVVEVQGRARCQEGSVMAARSSTDNLRRP